MTALRYNTPNDRRRRVLRPSDLERLGLPGFDQDLVFERANRWTLELPKVACDTLLRALPGEFDILEPQVTDNSDPVVAGNPTDDEQVDDSSADDPEELPDGVLSEADVMIDESPRPQRRRR